MERVMAGAFLTFGTAFVLALGLIPVVRRYSLRVGKVARPREDRWHQKPTAMLGGLGIFLSFLISLLIGVTVTGSWDQIRWGLVVAFALMFLLGLYDDFKPISPPAKLVGQILAASLVVFLGYTTGFFTPRLQNSLLAQAPNILLTFFWLVGITNAINLLDNMDGLAGGIALITAAILSFFFWQTGNLAFLIIALALAGSLLGFLVFNFPPASIFMGDSGSLFLGFTLAALAIARQPQASNVFAVMAVPTLLFLLPILDTTLVTFTRLLRGQSPAQGGRDHTSHRLIAFGLSERQAVLVLYGVALLSGVMAALLEALKYWYSLVIVPVLLLSLALLTAYLGGLKVVSPATAGRGKPLARIMLELTFKRRLLEVILDFFLIAFTYYLAFLTRFGLVLGDNGLEQYLTTMPVALAAAYISAFAFGVYRGVWRYVGLGELVRFGQAAAGSGVLSMAAVWLLYSNTGLSPVIFLLYGVYLFLGFAITRSSFRLLDLIAAENKTRQKEERILIYGAGDAGEMALRWILMNPEMDYRPVGFLDNDPFMVGRQIHGVEVLGGPDQLEDILLRKQVDGLILADQAQQAYPPEKNDGGVDNLVNLCQQHGCWVRSLRLEFELIE